MNSKKPFVLAIVIISNLHPCQEQTAGGGDFDIRGISAYSDQPVVGNVVLDGMSEADGLAIKDS